MMKNSSLRAASNVSHRRGLLFSLHIVYFSRLRFEAILQPSHPRSLRGVVRRHPEGGAGSGVLRPAACNRSPREVREVARQALRPGCEELAARIRRQLPAVVGRRAPKETEARPRGPKPPRWSAERRASRVMGRKAPRKAPDMPRYGMSNGCRCTRTFLGAPPTPRLGVSEAKMQTLGADMRRGNEMGCLKSE